MHFVHSDLIFFFFWVEYSDLINMEIFVLMNLVRLVMNRQQWQAADLVKEVKFERIYIFFMKKLHQKCGEWRLYSIVARNREKKLDLWRSCRKLYLWIFAFKIMFSEPQFSRGKTAIVKRHVVHDCQWHLWYMSRYGSILEVAAPVSLRWKVVYIWW